MLTNEQLLHNTTLEPVGRKSDPFMAQHFWYAALTPHGVYNSGPAGFLLIFFFAYTAFLTLREPIYYFMKYCCCCCKSLVVEDFEVDEYIDLYQNCLDQDDKDWTIAEEENMRQYGMSTLLPTTEQSYNDATFNPKYHLEGIHTYDILCNPIYSQMFQYFPAVLGKNRKDYIIDGDMDSSNDNA
jgi:hypothetical protein